MNDGEWNLGVRKPGERTTVAIYVFAGRNGKRRITIDEAEWVDENSYHKLRTIADGQLAVNDDDPTADQCFFISGHITRDC